MRRTRSVLVATAGSLALSMVAVPAGAGPLLFDNFTGAGNPDSSNVNYNLAGRQSGTLAPLTYTVTGNTQVGNTSTLRSNNGDYLLMAFDGKVSPDQNFKGGLSQGGLTINFNVDPDSNVDGDDWTSVNVGMSQADRLTFVADPPTHFGFLFRASGAFQAFDGNTNVGGGTYGPHNLGGTNDNFFPVRVEITDPTDGNPFDGVGQTTITVFGSVPATPAVPLFTYTKTGGGYADNFINFSSHHIGGIDDLSIAQAPEPATLGLGLIAGLGFLARRRRAR